MLANETAPDGHRFNFRVAQADEKETVLNVMRSAFAMDPTWGDIHNTVTGWVGMHAQAAFRQTPPSCGAVSHGTRIIGVSLVDFATDAEVHLLSGPCVLHEYRSRGLGSALLHASLELLAGQGLNVVFGLTRAQSTAARFVYPKFGGTAEPYEFNPDTVPKLAA
jgi:GNAT superfamily N-acetyltransferase